MRIGELLLHHGWVDPLHLRAALAEQQATGTRLCSLLIARGQLDPDHAARALAEQHGVAAALERHLRNRERPLAALLPAQVARARCALPIGRMRDGEVIICVRDPQPGLTAAYEQLTHKTIVIAVASAHLLEPLLASAYEAEVTAQPAPQPLVPAYAPALTAELSVRFHRPSSQPANVPTPPPPGAFAGGTERPMPTAATAADVAAVESIDINLDDSGAIAIPPFATAPAAPAALPETFTLVDLDDVNVERDPSQIGQPAGKAPSSTLPPGFGVAASSTLPPGFGVARPATLPPPNVPRDKKP